MRRMSERYEVVVTCFLDDDTPAHVLETLRGHLGDAAGGSGPAAPEADPWPLLEPDPGSDLPGGEAGALARRTGTPGGSSAAPTGTRTIWATSTPCWACWRRTWPSRGTAGTSGRPPPGPVNRRPCPRPSPSPVAATPSPGPRTVPRRARTAPRSGAARGSPPPAAHSARGRRRRPRRAVPRPVRPDRPVPSPYGRGRRRRRPPPVHRPPAPTPGAVPGGRRPGRRAAGSRASAASGAPRRRGTVRVPADRGRTAARGPAAADGAARPRTSRPEGRRSTPAAPGSQVVVMARA